MPATTPCPATDNLNEAMRKARRPHRADAFGRRKRVLHDLRRLRHLRLPAGRFRGRGVRARGRGHRHDGGRRPVRQVRPVPAREGRERSVHGGGMPAYRHGVLRHGDADRARRGRGRRRRGRYAGHRRHQARGRGHHSASEGDGGEVETFTTRVMAASAVDARADTNTNTNTNTGNGIYSDDYVTEMLAWIATATQDDLDNMDQQRHDAIFGQAPAGCRRQPAVPGDDDRGRQGGGEGRHQRDQRHHRASRTCPTTTTPAASVSTRPTRPVWRRWSATTSGPT